MHCRRQHLGCVELKLHDGDSIAAPWLIAGVLDCSRSNKIICGGKLMETHSTSIPGKIIRPQWNNEIFQKVHIHNGRWHDSLFNIYHTLFLISSAPSSFYSSLQYINIFKCMTASRFRGCLRTAWSRLMLTQHHS